jgi:hypothetical protein
MSPSAAGGAQKRSAEYASETENFLQFARALGAKELGGGSDLPIRADPCGISRSRTRQSSAPTRAHFLRRARRFGFATLAAFFAAGLRADLERFLAMFSILPLGGARLAAVLLGYVASLILPPSVVCQPKNVDVSRLAAL